MMTWEIRSRRTKRVVWCLDVVFLALMVGGSVEGGDGVRPARSEEEHVRDAVEWVAEEGALLKRSFGREGIDGKEARRLAERVPKMEKDSVVSAALDVFRAKAVFLDGDAPAYGRLKQRLRDATALSPELLQVEETLGSEGTGAERRHRWDELGRLLPLTKYRYSMDRRSGEGALVDPPLPEMPEGPVSANCEKIGEIYAGSGLLREAVDALLESVYDTRARQPDPGYADRWYRIGTYEEEMGEQLLAARAYLNAVHNDPTRKAEITGALMRAVSGKPRSGQEVGRAVSRLPVEKALEIARLYAQCNLHPRALELLSKYEMTADSAEGRIREEIREEWISKIVKLYRLVKGPDCVLLGRRVDAVKDWATVKIPRPSDLFWKPQGAAGAGTRPAGGK
jgi:tetratricopeptide (TPR) repeat protein